jgi:hypothetical protein
VAATVVAIRKACSNVVWLLNTHDVNRPWVGARTFGRPLPMKNWCAIDHRCSGRFLPESFIRPRCSDVQVSSARTAAWSAGWRKSARSASPATAAQSMRSRRRAGAERCSRPGASGAAAEEGGETTLISAPP